MRAALTLLLAACMASASYAQCKYERNEVDKFTKDKVVVTRAKSPLFGAMVEYFDFRSQAGSYFIDIHSSVRRDFDGVPDGATLMFMLANDSVVEAKATHGAPVLPRMVGNMMAYFFDCTYAIDRAGLERMQASPVTAMRFYHYTSYSDVEVKKTARQERMQKAIICLLQAE